MCLNYQATQKYNFKIKISLMNSRLQANDNTAGEIIFWRHISRLRTVASDLMNSV